MTKHAFLMAAVCLCGALLTGCASGDNKKAFRQDIDSLRSRIEAMDVEHRALAKKATGQWRETRSRITRLEGEVERLQIRFAKLLAEKKMHAIGHTKRQAGPARKPRKAVKVKPRHTGKPRKTQKPRPAPATNKSAVAGERSHYPAKTREKPRPSESAAIDDGRQAYFNAFTALKSGRYADASAAFKHFLEKHPTGRYTWQATYWLGESLYAEGKTNQAIAALGRAVQAPPNMPRRAAALLRLGQLYRQQGNIAEAKTTLMRLLREHPNSFEAEAAKRLLSGD